MPDSPHRAPSPGASRPRRRALPACSVLAVLLGLTLLAAGNPAAASGGPEPLDSPLHLALAGPGVLVVTDASAAGVRLVDAASLEVMADLRLPGGALGVAADAGRLFVAERGQGRIRVFLDRGGGRWRPAGWWLGPGAHLGQPQDLAVDGRTGRLYVLTTRPVAVVVLSRKGRPLPDVRIPAPGEPAPLAPTALSLDPEAREIFVSDHGDPRTGAPAALLVYGYDGRLRARLSGDGAQAGFRFSRPQGSAVHGGEVYLVDSLLGQVLVFDRATWEGRRVLGTYGAGGDDAPGRLRLPLDLVVDPALGRVLVTNNRLDRVEVLADGETLP